jgi:putative SOS response-associated peptidase YedK
MCGRFSLQTSEARVRAVFNMQPAEQLNLKPRYNITPSQDVLIVRDASQGNELVTARWGLVPHWSKESTTKYSTINARIETVAEKPTYRTPFKNRR